MGRVSYYLHHGALVLYYLDGDLPNRLRVADTEEEAEQIAAQVNTLLASSSPTLFSFTSVSFSELRQTRISEI